MIGKAEWFKRRKYGGWGLYPKNYKGWLYIAAFLIPFIIIQSLPFLNSQIKLIATIFIFAILAFDTISIMVKLKLDEREAIHEAKSERNAMWTVITILVFGVAYQVASSSVKQLNQVDPFLIAALIGAFIVKAISNIYYDRYD